MSAAEEYRETWDPCSKTTKNGFTMAKYLTDEQVDAIFEHAREGLPINLACQKEGTSSTQFFRKAKREPELMARWEKVREEGRVAYQELLREQAFIQAVQKQNYKALRDQMILHLPEAAALATARLQIGNMDDEEFRMLAVRQLGQVSDEDLAHLIEIFNRKKEEDGKVVELPRAVDA